MTISVPKLTLGACCKAWHKCGEFGRPLGCNRYAHTGAHRCNRCKTQVWYDGPRPGDES